MADPARSSIDDDTESSIRPNLRAIDGGGEKTSSRGNLHAVASDLQGKEKSVGDNVTVGPWAGSSVNPVQEAEEQGNGFYKPGGGKAKKKSGSKGALAFILTVVFGGGVGVLGFFGGQALLPIHVVENLVNKYDTQSTSMTIRTNKILANKLSNSVTTDSCAGLIKIMCRYTRPSNNLLDKLTKNGIVPVDKAGNPIKRSPGILPNERPAAYKFNGGDPIPANKLASTMAKDAELRAAFHAANNPRFIGLTDKIFDSIKTRFGFKTSDKLAGVKNAKEATSALNGEVGGAAGKAAVAETAAGVDTLLEKELTASTNKIAKAGKGNLIGLAAGATCMIGDVPGLIIRTVRAFQMAQVIKYSMVILSAVGAMKAGDATPEEASTIGSLLTTVVAGKSAMDSFGMKYSLFGDTKPAKGSNFLNFSPGSKAIDTLGGISQFTSSAAKQQACSVAMNPVTGAAIDAATSETLVVPIVNAALGTILAMTISALAPGAISTLVQLIPTQQILQFFIGDLTANISGQDVGDALTSGASNLMSQTANAGGNMPLTVDQAVAYNTTTQQVNLAYAQEDRATLSPLDASSPNTMMGSFVNQLLPYYSNMASISGILSTIGGIVGGSLGSLTQQITAKAANGNPDQYTLCPDPSLAKVAAGPFCNVVYGIPPQYLNEDPETVLMNLYHNGQVDADGNVIKPADNPALDALSVSDVNESAKGSLSGWMDLCTSGSTDQADNCKITDQTTAEYALYTIDNRALNGLDGITDNNTTTPDTTSAAVTNDSSDLIGFINSSTDVLKTTIETLSDTLKNISYNKPKPVQSFSYVSTPTDNLLPPWKYDGVTA